MGNRRSILCLLHVWILIAASSVVFAIRVYAPVKLESRALNEREACSDEFLARELDHITFASAMPVGYYDSNGAGLAIGDLNKDGLLDIVMANLAGDNHVFWNRGGLQFEREALPSQSPARAAATIDVDGDGCLDIVFTQQATAPLYWRNQGGESFKTQVLNGVSYIGYAMNWLDADRDGDLDLVTGSYDVENEKILGQTAPKAGVIYYENLGGSFHAQRIAGRSNTLAIWTGINRDGEHEIIIGNDFAVVDKTFTFRDDAWQETDALDVMPHSTMSYDSADLDNDGMREVFAVDMKPYADDAETLAQWQPVMDMMMAMPHIEGDPQIMENVLYAGSGGQPVNIARAMRLDGTGWSWSAKFGDLDNDGYQDLYVVNGMISVELFSHLPNNELVEENQVYRNLSGAGFAPQLGWGLNDRASGRGMSLADLDNDGDLDVVVNNLLSPAMVFENRLCAGPAIEVDLRWKGIGNGAGIGSQLILKTDLGEFRRDVTALSGYLSGESSRVHFGFPVDAALQRLTIIWSDGEVSRIEELGANTLITVTRD
ncbi:MAG: CRTAC1 family protein [Chloroflexi bacterium]|nr:CRTAC1 family protein [Chloroflexota bacterium]